MLVSSLLLLGALAVPQDPAPALFEHQKPISLQHGLPGSRPGTELWLVTLKSRSFDLTRFREASHSGAPAAVIDAIVTDLERKVREDQKDFVEFVESLGGRVIDQWWIVNGLKVEIPATKVPELRAHPRVFRLDPEEYAYPVGLIPIKTSTNSKNHNADSVQNRNIKGAGVTVAIMDTGLDHPMGSSGRPHRTFYVNGDPNNKTGGGIGGSRLIIHKTLGRAGPDDVHNHGTGVAGIAAGEKWGNAAGDAGHAPLAKLGNYCIADSPSGGAQFGNIVKAWQAIAADAAKNKIVAANNSYTGSPDPTHLSQQALDSAALNANVLPVCAAGNSGSSTSRSQSVANGLAVGAVNPAKGGALDKRVATFSSRGPLFGDTQRFYPDLAANGVSTVMPLRNNEAGNYVASGTSMASPQVCGAATLFRSVRPNADTLQTKAAILATTEDISKQNPNPPYNSRNAYGMGYLRDDRLIALATGGGLVTNGTINSTSQPVVINFHVTRGKGYAFALTWHRQVLTSKNWSDLNLEVRMGAQSLGASTTPRNLYEKVVILAPATGAVQIVVSAKSLEKPSIKFGLAAAEIPPPFVDGRIDRYGVGCIGTGKQVGVETVLPTGLATMFGRTYSEIGVGYDNHRFQQVFSQAAVPASFQARQIAFRLEDASFPGAVRNYWAELEIDMGYSPNDPAKMSTTFAANVVGTPTRVLARKRVNLPDYTGRNTDPKNFAIKIPLDRAFVHKTTAGRYLMVDIRKTNSSVGNRVVNYFLDATNDASKMWASRLYGRTPTATIGSLATGLGVVMGFNAAVSGAVPQLGATGTPEIGGTYSLTFAQAAPSTGAWLVVGASDKKWGAFNLPFSLASLGAPGCSVLASVDATVSVSIDAFGNGRASISVPNNKAFIQANLFHQGVIADPKANGLGLVVTNGLRAILGGQP